MKFLKQTGSSLIYSMVVLSILGGVSIHVLQNVRVNKLAEADLAKFQSAQLFERKIAILLHEAEICSLNFTTLGASVPDLKNSATKVIYKQNKFYYGKAVKFLGMTSISHPDEPTTKFFVDVSYEKHFSKNGTPPQLKVKRFEVSASNINQTTQAISGCEYQGEAPLDLVQLMNDKITAFCQGPGMVSNAGGICSTKKPYASATDPNLVTLTCPDGLSISEVTLDSANRLRAVCKPIITAAECAFGIKYKDQPGQFECLALSDIVDQEMVSAPNGTVCNVSLSGGKYKLNCE
jgi:hypothetical protein